MNQPRNDIAAINQPTPPYNTPMSWFQKFCRNAGLMVHGIKQPIKEDKAQRGTKEVIKHEVKEEHLDENVVLRRTTIEEIETRRNAPETSLASAKDKSAPANQSDQPTLQNETDGQP